MRAGDEEVGAEPGRASSDGDAATPAAVVSAISTKARLPTLPNACMNRFARGSSPGPGSSKASSGTATSSNPRAPSARVSTRSVLPCVICGKGRLEIMSATMVAGTAMAASATMALAELDQVCERMPPASTISEAQATAATAMTISDCPVSQAEA